MCGFESHKQLLHTNGLLHTNANALSRPVMVVDALKNETVLILQKNLRKNYAKDIDDEENSPKNLDPYEDDGLIHYLKLGRHLPGLSSKRVKRIENIAHNYSMIIDSDDFILNYKKNNIFLPMPRITRGRCQKKLIY